MCTTRFGLEDIDDDKIPSVLNKTSKKLIGIKFVINFVFPKKIKP